MGSVLVAVASNWISIARLPRVLARAGLRVEVLCTPDAALAHTKYVDARHELAPGGVAEHAEALRRHLERHRYDWVIAGDDPLVAHLCTLEDAGWLAAWFPVAIDRDNRDRIASKPAFVAAASRFGVAVPRSFACESSEQVRAAIAALDGAVIVKRARSHGGIGIQAFATATEAMTGNFSFASPADPVVVQELVRGRVGNTLVLFGRGRAMHWLSSVKARTWPGPFAPSCAKQAIDHLEVEPMLDAIGRMTGFHGFAAIDWIIDDRSGHLLALELNARPAPGIHLGEQLAADFAPAVRRFVAGSTERLPRAAAPSRVVSMFPEDLFRAVTEKDEPFLARWRADITLRSDVPTDDAQLLAYYLQRRSLRRLFDGLVASERLVDAIAS
jgi:predicted ATP-grasp superfamily ATP-dependent carboligase